MRWKNWDLFPLFDIPSFTGISAYLSHTEYAFPSFSYSHITANMALEKSFGLIEAVQYKNVK
jgi:hypothetical protein